MNGTLIVLKFESILIPLYKMILKMKRTIMAIALMATVGTMGAQEISESVNQRVDQRIAKWETTLEVSAEQKTKLREVLVKYVTLIENERKSVTKDRANSKEVDASVVNLREQMRKNVEAVLTPEQLKKLEASTKSPSRKAEVDTK